MPWPLQGLPPTDLLPAETHHLWRQERVGGCSWKPVGKGGTTGHTFSRKPTCPTCAGPCKIGHRDQTSKSSENTGDPQSHDSNPCKLQPILQSLVRSLPWQRAGWGAARPPVTHGPTMRGGQPGVRSLALHVGRTGPRPQGTRLLAAARARPALQELLLALRAPRHPGWWHRAGASPHRCLPAPTGASPAAAGGDGLLCLDTGRRKPRGPGMVAPSSTASLGLAPVALCMCTCVRICTCVPSPAGSRLAENPLPHAEKRPFFAVTIQYN